MGLDDLVLGLQRGIDRLVRRCQVGRRPEPTRARLLVIQIDGLSRAVLEEALARRRMPFLARVLARQGHRLEPMSVGLPSSTPAFQMAAMYGVQPDIPGFHYHDKRRREDVHFPRKGHAALVEAAQAGGRVGILRGGSVYGCVFTGGAENGFWSFAQLTRPSGAGLTRALSPLVVIAWVVIKSVTLTVVEVARALVRVIADPLGARRHWEWLKLKVALSVWVRELFTLGAARDLYAGLPAVYVNFLDYDVAAHAFGPHSRRALRSLGLVDRSIRQLWRILRRVPEYRYDCFILSDHGQAHCTSYAKLAGAPFEQYLLDTLVPGGPGQSEPALESPRLTYPHGFWAYGIGGKGRGRDPIGARRQPPAPPGARIVERETAERDGVRIISAGPNAFVYVVDTPEPLDADQLEDRLPGLAAAISTSPGVGFVLARSGDGPVCFFRGKKFALHATESGPFDDREDRDLVVRYLADLMAMRSAGDLVIYGIGAPEGDVSFIAETGAHAGPSPHELHTFIIRPAGVRLPAPITHPIQLYDLFMRYQDGGAPPPR